LSTPPIAVRLFLRDNWIVQPMGGTKMHKFWKRPQIVEVAVGLEINSYACADL
jgi:coenzyme PQQ precursor peptide PqqA